jgi:hypothetical protein
MYVKLRNSMMNSPKSDDFRLERNDGSLLVTFTPDGRSYTFEIQGDELLEQSASPAQTSADDYADDEVRRTAFELASLALKGKP